MRNIVAHTCMNILALTNIVVDRGSNSCDYCSSNANRYNHIKRRRVTKVG